MSVASLAIQIRAPCARSRACKLGSPITLLPPPRPAIPAHVPDQILALPSGFGHSAAALRSASRPVSWPGTPPLALPRILPSCISVSFSLRHRATLLCDHHLPQDAVHVALTMIVRIKAHSVDLVLRVYRLKW